MGRLLYSTLASLDGYIADADGRFDWAAPSEEVHAAVNQRLHGVGTFLLGRRTYEVFAEHWPNASEEEQVVAIPLNTMPKYVASRTLREPLEWENSTLLTGDVAQAVTALKQEDGGDLLLIGSTQLLHTLIEQNLLDALRLMIDPLVLGGGKRMFPEDGALRQFRLIHSEPTTTGAILTTYAIAEPAT